MPTDVNGNTNATSNATFHFGPYLQGGSLPVNPFDGTSTVIQIASFPPAAATGAGGWLYEPVSGQIAANTTGHLTD